MIVAALLGDDGLPLPQHVERARAGGGHRLHVLDIVHAPAYATSDYTERSAAGRAPRRARTCRRSTTRFSVVGFGGTNTAFAGFGLCPGASATRSQATVQQDVQTRLNDVAGVQAFVFAPPTLPGTGGGLPVQFVIRSTGDPDQVFEVAEEIKNRAQASGRFIVVQNSLAFSQPQALVTIDRDRAAALGVHGQRDRHDAHRLVGGGRSRNSTARAAATTSSRRCRRAPLQPRRPRRLLRAQRQRRDGAALGRDSGSRRGAAPVAIEQFNQLNSATISGLPLPGVATGDALATFRPIAPK